MATPCRRGSASIMMLLAPRLRHARWSKQEQGRIRAVICYSSAQNYTSLPKALWAILIVVDHYWGEIDAGLVLILLLDVSSVPRQDGVSPAGACFVQPRLTIRHHNVNLQFIGHHSLRILFAAADSYIVASSCQLCLRRQCAAFSLSCLSANSHSRQITCHSSCPNRPRSPMTSQH